MEIKNKLLIHNRFDIEVMDSVTGEVKQSFTSFNIVLSQMYTRLCDGSSYFVNIHFGSGSGSLSPVRTTLFTHLGTKTALDDTLIKSIPLSTWKRKIVLNPEEYVGSTITEVGIAFGATNTNLVTHSMLKDGEGNPISIVKTNTDVVTIYATVFVTFDNSNPNLVYIGMPSANTLVNYLIGGGVAPTGAFSLNDIYLGVSKLGSTDAVVWTSDVPNKLRKTNVPRFGTTVGNGQVKFLGFDNIFSLELPYAPVFNGQSYTGVSLGVGDGVKDTFDLPSANIKDVSLVIKKNGVITTEYSTLEKLGLFRNRMPLRDAFYDGSLGANISKDGKVIASSQRYGFDSWMLVDGMWVRRGGVPNSPANYNFDVGLSFNGSVIVGVGEASPYVVSADWNGVSWIARPLPSVRPASSTRGASVSNNGNVVAFGGEAIFVYDWVDGVYIKRLFPDMTGVGYVMMVRLSGDGNSIAYASNSGIVSVGVFDWNGTSWITRPSVGYFPMSSNACYLSDDSSILAVGYSDSPRVAVFDWNGSVWTKRANIPNGLTGQTIGVGMSGDGLQLTVGTTDALCYMYVYNGVTWDFMGNYEDGDFFAYGASQSLDGRYLFVRQERPNVFERLKYSKIKLNTPPAIGDVITADYTVDGVHKTDQYVIDVSFAIQFGEGI